MIKSLYMLKVFSVGCTV